MRRQHYKPVFIIGAPRSGTNMLRDILCRFNGVGTWPCDEINYIWRHGNVRYPSDEFTPVMVTPSVRQYIRKWFDDLAEGMDLDFIIEKTCANSLRVDFLGRVFPEAKYIFIVRNGVDVVSSAVKRWKASLDVPYVLKKIHFVPWCDLPYYAFCYLGNHVYRLFSSDKRLSSWGPRLHGMGRILKEHSLEEVCAIQWKRCVDTAAESFVLMPPEKFIQIRYEDLVQNPRVILEKIVCFLNVPFVNPQLEASVAGVFSGSVGKGHMELGPERLERVRSIVENTLSVYGYK